MKDDRFAPPSAGEMQNDMITIHCLCVGLNRIGDAMDEESVRVRQSAIEQLCDLTYRSANVLGRWMGRPPPRVS
jgi:hypothetical protein